MERGMDEAGESLGLDTFLEVWSRRKWLAILVFAEAFTAVVGVVTFLPDIYRSSATVMIERQQVPEAFIRSTVTSAVESRLQTITQEILSRSRLVALIDRFGLYPDLKKRLPMEEVVEQLRRDIQLEVKGVEQKIPGRAMVAFAITFRGSDPQKVASVTNTLASFYIEENLKVRERQAAGTSEFLQVQLAETKKRLDEQERQVSEFKRRYMGELPQQLEANLSTLERLNAQLRLNSENQARANERRALFVKQLAEAETSGPIGGPDATAARIARLKQELTELKTRFNDKYPDIIQLKAEIDALELQLTRAKQNKEAEKEEAAPASLYVIQLKKVIETLDAEIKFLKAEEQKLRRAIPAYQGRVENVPQRELEFQALSRDYGTTQELYHTLVRRHDEAKLAESLEQRQKGEQFRILDPATPSEQPAAPKRGRLIFVGLMFSLGLAGGVVILAEQLNTSFHRVDDLWALSKIRVLVSIPCIVTEADARRSRKRFYLGATAAMLGLAFLVGFSYVVTRGDVPVVGPFVQSQLLR